MCLQPDKLRTYIGCLETPKIYSYLCIIYQAHTQNINTCSDLVCRVRVILLDLGASALQLLGAQNALYFCFQ